jgi:hypothetical protein
MAPRRISTRESTMGAGMGANGNGSGRLAMICVADTDTRLVCNSICVACEHYMRDRRRGERRAAHRRTRDRRILAREY